MKKTKNRVVSLLLTLIMVMSMVIALPMTVMAAAPVITSEIIVNRVSDEEVVVTFTVDVFEGQYYYKYDGTPPADAEALIADDDSIFAAFIGSDEVTHNDPTLTSGPHTLYIAMGSTSDEFGEIITIPIPAYSPPAAPVITFGTTTTITTINAVLHYTLSDKATVTLRIYTGVHTPPETLAEMNSSVADTIGCIERLGPSYHEILDNGQTLSNNLQPNTTYTVYGIATNTNGTSAIVSTEFTTSSLPKYPVYVVTSDTFDGGLGFANPNYLEAGEEVTLTTTIYPGSVFKEWIVDTDNVTIINDKFIMPAEPVSITAVFEKFGLKITAGANQSWTKDSSNNISITCNGDYSFFDSITMDGVVINPANYSKVEGSTVITLNASYLQTLSAGSHTIVLNYYNSSIVGQAPYVYEDSISTGLTIRAADSGTDTTGSSTVSTRNPNTGDMTNILTWIIILVGSLAGMVVLFIRRKRQYN